MMNKRIIDKIVEVLEDTDWNIYVDNEAIQFSKISPAGQDFSVIVSQEDIKSLDDLIESISNRYDNFDVSAEAYLWLDSNGHGVNGAPYEMIDVYNDMEACCENIDELHQTIENISLITIKEDLIELMDEVVTRGELEYIEEHEQVLAVTDCGYGRNNQRWFSVLLENCEECDVYLQS